MRKDEQVGGAHTHRLGGVFTSVWPLLVSCSRDIWRAFIASWAFMLVITKFTSATSIFASKVQLTARVYAVIFINPLKILPSGSDR
jgi:hypothetical protein